MSASPSDLQRGIPPASRAALISCAIAVLASLPFAAIASRYEAARLGAFLGAMKYCEDRYDEQERRYQRARIRAARELEDMSRGERAQAFRSRERAYERGQFFGDRLDRGGCRSLLRASEWRHFYGD